MVYPSSLWLSCGTDDAKSAGVQGVDVGTCGRVRRSVRVALPDKWLILDPRTGRVRKGGRLMQTQGAVENRMLDTVNRLWSVELPYCRSLQEYLVEIVPLVRPWSEDLREKEFYVSEDGSKPWLEITDSAHAQEAVLHYFERNGEYIRVVEGHVTNGHWRHFSGSNKIVIDHGGQRIMYELQYLDDNFFILRQYGYNERSPWLFFGHEPRVRGLPWRDCVELLFDTYRRRARNVRLMMVFAAVLIGLIILFSVF